MVKKMDKLTAQEYYEKCLNEGREDLACAFALHAEYICSHALINRFEDIFGGYYYDFKEKFWIKNSEMKLWIEDYNTWVTNGRKQ